MTASCCFRFYAFFCISARSAEIISKDAENTRQALFCEYARIPCSAFRPRSGGNRRAQKAVPSPPLALQKKPTFAFEFGDKDPLSYIIQLFMKICKLLLIFALIRKNPLFADFSVFFRSLRKGGRGSGAPRPLSGCSNRFLPSVFRFKRPHRLRQLS